MQILVVYVDDLVMFAKNENVLQFVTNMLKDSLEITEIGLTKYLLGVNFVQINGSLFIHQRTYIERLELKYKDLPKSYVKLPFRIGYVLPDKVNENEIIEK